MYIKLIQNENNSKYNYNKNNLKIMNLRRGVGITLHGCYSGRLKCIIVQRGFTYHL